MRGPRFTAVMLCLLSVIGTDLQSAETALDRYVGKPDASYGYVEYDRRDQLAAVIHYIRMTSQQWRSATEVDRPLWQHDLLVVRPRIPLAPVSHNAILLIDGGDNDGRGPSAETANLAATLAVVANAVVAVVRQIPNQPLSFSDETARPRSEDAVLAYSLDKYLTTGDEQWPVHLAMTKAVVRAMDTVQAVAASQGNTIDGFVLVGGSKRGWAAWLAAAVDSRVTAVVAVSFDALNLGEQFVHHWEAYGFYAPALSDYVEFDLPCRLDSQRGHELLAIVDPFEYRDRYRIPKLVINSGGDQFFVSDSSQYYYDDLPSPKHLRYTLNTDHAQGDLQDVVLAALLWIQDVDSGAPAPQYSWTVDSDGSLRVQVDPPAEKAYLWQANNPGARDFRLEAIGPAWTATELFDIGGGMYVGSIPPPASGFAAFTVELVFEQNVAIGLLTADQRYTTEVRVTPDILPFRATACGGTSPVPRLTASTGFLHLPVVQVPGVDSFNAVLRGTDPGLAQFALQALLTASAAAISPAIFLPATDNLEIPLVEVEETGERLHMNMTRLAGSSPMRFEVTELRALPTEPASYSFTTGILTLPAVQVDGGRAFRVSLRMSDAATLELTLEQVLPLLAPPLSPSSYGSATGTLSIPDLVVAETANHYAVEMQRVAGSEPLRFIVTRITRRS